MATTEEQKTSEYVKKVLDWVKARDKDQPEFIQAVEEVLPTLQPVLDQNPKMQREAILERLVEPDRQIVFRVTWTSEDGVTHVNRGMRVQFNNSIGPYKGGLRFHPSVNLGIIKFLGFEQIFKNSLTGLPIGGGKGGCDFDPKLYGDHDVMRFCQAFMSELYKYIGADKDVPAGDIGVGAREIGYMYGMYKKLTGLSEGVLTGKGISYGGSLARPEATGYGLVYFVGAMLGANGKSFQDQTVVISGSGNVATFATQKAQEKGAKVVALSDSSGYVYDKDGIKLDIVREIKEVKRGRIKEYVDRVPSAEYVPDCSKIWEIKCDIALPCATQNEIGETSARHLIDNGVIAVGEGANMPCTIAATKAFQENGVLYGPAKAANAGGVAVSALEMAQNSARLPWTFKQVDDKLQDIMKNIYQECVKAAQTYDMPGNLVAGANIAGFLKVADAMLAHGAV